MQILNFMKKKIISFLIITGISITAFSQESTLKSKKGVPILPEPGNIALGIDARPFTNFFNDNSNVRFNFINDNAIYGKYFLDDKTAIRAKVRIGYQVYENTELVMKDGQSIPNPNIQVEDIEKDTRTDFTIGLGYEKRRGESRVQGFFGGEVLFTMYDQFTEYDYGNKYSTLNPNPTSHDFGTNIPAPAQRYTEIDYSTQYQTSIRGFIGAEYFIAPKLSVGGEFGWGFGYDFAGEGENELEYWQGGEVQKETIETGGIKGFDIDTDNFNGVVFLMFHF